MVVSNKSVKDLMQHSPDSNNTILHRICTKRRTKAFSFFTISIIKRRTYIDYLFESNDSDQRPYEYAIRYGAVSIAKKIFNIKAVRDRILNDNDNLFRLLYHLFVYNQKKYLIDYIISVLSITRDKISMIFKHRCASPAYGKFRSQRFQI